VAQNVALEVVYDDKPHVDPELVQLQCNKKRNAIYAYCTVRYGFCGGFLLKIVCLLRRHAFIIRALACNPRDQARRQRATPFQRLRP
jgi:hypothetical protein